MIRLAFLAMLLTACAHDDAVCPMPVAHFCDGQTQNCPTTWTAAQDVTSWNCGNGNGGLVTLTTCGSFEIASIAFIDAGKDFYYDETGQLVRVESFVNTRESCLAGEGERAQCGDPVVQTLCNP